MNKNLFFLIRTILILIVTILTINVLFFTEASTKLRISIIILYPIILFAIDKIFNRYYEKNDKKLDTFLFYLPLILILFLFFATWKFIF